jgi:hypothetical protein
LSTKESHALTKYADFVYDSTDSMCGALVHQPTLFETMLIDARSISILRDDKKERELLADTVEPTGDIDTDKPKLYLFVGPPKHGTTSMECKLAGIQVRCLSLFLA